MQTCMRMHPRASTHVHTSPRSRTRMHHIHVHIRVCVVAHGLLGQSVDDHHCKANTALMWMLHMRSTDYSEPWMSDRLFAIVRGSEL